MLRKGRGGLGAEGCAERRAAGFRCGRGPGDGAGLCSAPAAPPTLHVRINQQVTGTARRVQFLSEHLQRLNNLEKKLPLRLTF